MEIIIIIVGGIASLVTILTFIFGPESIIERWNKWRAGSKKINEPIEQKLTPLKEPINKDGFVYDVFISYSHKDELWADKVLRQRLDDADLKVCIDYRDFEAGKITLLNMQDAAKESAHVVLVLTRNWLNSEWSFFESLIAATKDPAGLQKKLIPLLCEDGIQSDVSDFIGMRTWVDFTRKDREEIAWNQLFRSCGVKKGLNPQKKTKETQENTNKSEFSHGHNTINTDYAIHDFIEMQNPDSIRRIMHIWGDSMMGKSHLTRDVFPKIVKSIHANLIDMRIEFTGFEGSETELMLQIMNLFPNPATDCTSFLNQYNNFTKKMSEATISQSNTIDFKQQRSDLSDAMTIALTDDIRRHGNVSFVFLFDAVNKISTELRDWLLRKLVFYLSQLKNVRIVLSSKEPLDLSYIHPLVCISYPLQTIQKFEPYIEYCQRHGMQIEDKEVQTIVYAARFNPGQFLILVKAFQKSKQGVNS